MWKLVQMCLGVHADEGFSRNVLWLLHGYSLYTPANGTFYLDATQWPFKCTDTGEVKCSDSSQP